MRSPSRRLRARLGAVRGAPERDGTDPTEKPKAVHGASPVEKELRPPRVSWRCDHAPLGGGSAGQFIARNADRPINSPRRSRDGMGASYAQVRTARSAAARRYAAAASGRRRDAGPATRAATRAATDRAAARISVLAARCRRISAARAASEPARRAAGGWHGRSRTASMGSWRGGPPGTGIGRSADTDCSHADGMLTDRRYANSRPGVREGVSGDGVIRSGSGPLAALQLGRERGVDPGLRCGPAGLHDMGPRRRPARGRRGCRDRRRFACPSDRCPERCRRGRAGRDHTDRDSHRDQRRAGGEQ